MATTDSGLWHYLDKWQSLASSPAPVWKDGRLDNAACAECRYCCGPQDNAEPFPMALLPNQIGPDNAANFYMLDKNTAGLGARGCKSDGPHGCRLPVGKRPVACSLFPIVLINGQLYLYQICPMAISQPLAIFYQLGREIASRLMDFPLEDLRRISISLPEQTLLDRYINLHIQIFNETGKKLLFE